MPEDLLRYDLIIETALRSVVSRIMTKVAASGLPGDHHFYVSFLTGHAGVQLSSVLRQKYPHEMVIVLQHQFRDLTVGEDSFSVSLSFSGVLERLVIPFAAITAFSDPSVNFALQFQAVENDGAAGDQVVPFAPASTGDQAASIPVDQNALSPPATGGGEVISLDKFRKK